VGLRGLNIAARKAYHALKRFRKFNCIMRTISPYMNDRPHALRATLLPCTQANV
jgi:hypothetical protein